MTITFPPKKRFVLYAPTARHESPGITFEGYEWNDLPLASYAVKNKGGEQFAVEIKGRCFTLDFQEMPKITQSGIPFLLGFHRSDNTVVLPCPGICPECHLAWITEEERVVEPALRIVEDKEDGQWKKGTVGPYIFWAKVYDLPSKYGIHEGNISKLDLRLAATDQIVANYDRGWDILPDDETDPNAENIRMVIDAIVDHYKVPENAGETDHTLETEKEHEHAQETD